MQDKPALFVPTRVQLSRAKGWRMPANTVKVDRSTVFGNPFTVSKGSVSGGGEPRREGFFVGGAVNKLFETRIEAQRVSAAAFEGWLVQWPQHKLLTAAQHALAGKNLACWCRLDQPCHADVLLRLVNAIPPASPTA